ncbi:MAG: 16S rRNA (cytosine(1402)-N(4))-methyltransferase RsmH, partial [Candidatus Caldatribacteriaceae bacterium]
YVDATVGGGGHALAILEKLQQTGHLVGIDRDKETLRKAENNLRDFAEQITLCHGPFSRMSDILTSLGIHKVRGILFDLGVSSFHLDQGERGFSFERNGPLDMRMDTTQDIDAFWVVNHFQEKYLAELIYRYGEEPFARQIARAIVRKRIEKPINSTRELAQIVEAIVPRRGKIHPATRTFMALRIFVNRELEELSQALLQIPDLLAKRGRVVVLSYHSLEDRMVKRFFRGCSKLLVLTKKPLRPREEEVRENPRSRSARLRVAERVEA